MKHVPGNGEVCSFEVTRVELVEKRAEATSEAQDTLALPTELSNALFAGCAINLFFNKLLEPTCRNAGSDRNRGGKLCGSYQTCPEHRSADNLLRHDDDIARVEFG